MKQDKTPTIVIASSFLIILSAMIARINGCSVSVLALLAAIQLLITLGLFLTMPLSLVQIVRAVRLKEWKKARQQALSLMLPVFTWCLVALINKPGYDAVMSV